MQTIDLAVVIPTLNEEKYIGALLDTLASQTVQPKEVVVVDAFSKDRTEQEVKKRFKVLPQLKLYQIPKYTVARQRNFGAHKTTASHLLFLDADMQLPDPETLDKYWYEVTTKNPDIAAADNLPLSDYWKDKLFFSLEHTIYKSAKPIWPMVTGRNIYIKRTVFKRVNGFDEHARIGEDFDIVQRVVKNGSRFRFLKHPKVYTSTRRIAKEGRGKFAVKMVKSFLYVIRYGYRQNPTEYEFGKFDRKV